jgi:hypothetical protein
MYKLKPEDYREVLNAVSRPAVISKKIYADIEKILHDEPTLSRQEAFRRYSKESGRALGAISANYYREARNLRQAAATGGVAGKPRTTEASDAATLDQLDVLARQLTENIQQLVALVAEQRRSLAEERERIEQAKRAILDA